MLDEFGHTAGNNVALRVPSHGWGRLVPAWSSENQPRKHPKTRLLNAVARLRPNDWYGKCACGCGKPCTEVNSVAIPRIGYALNEQHAGRALLILTQRAREHCAKRDATRLRHEKNKQARSKACEPATDLQSVGQEGAPAAAGDAAVRLMARASADLGATTASPAPEKNSDAS